MDYTLILLISSLAVLAFLYSSIGYGGAIGYLAVMALFGVAPMMMKTSALIMNLAVAVTSFIGFYRGGHFKLKLFWPFAITSIPLSYLGGMMTLPDSIYKKILAVCLLISIVRLLYQFRQSNQETKEIPIGTALVAGGLIGLLSGAIGLGGGVILSPLMLLMRWATFKETAAVSALFISVNSLSGLFGQMNKGGIHLTDNLQYAVLATIVGGLLGSYCGSQKFNVPTLKYVLATVLTVASFKLMFT